MTVLTKTAVSLGLMLVLSACSPSFYEVPVETPLQPKLDISNFQRILIAGFISGGTEEVDTNAETARLLRSQLRSNSRLQVINADVMELDLIAEELGGVASRGRKISKKISTPDNISVDDMATENETLSEEDLETYEHIFANANYWKRLGEEYQNPLIVTGTIYFTTHKLSGLVTREQEIYDEFGRRQVRPVRTYRDREGYVLSPKFIFIDGRTGATLYTERHREEILYDSSQNTPALSSYFELMDRLLPSFLNALSNQTIKGTRILLM